MLATVTAAAALALAACAPANRRDPLTATGELVALSGGGSGATNACFVCHGLAGQGDGGGVPRLAAVPAGYLQKQLEDYATRRRSDPVMSPISAALRSQDRRAVAVHYASLPGTSGALGPAVTARGISGLYHEGDVRRGLAACASCHGDSGEGAGAANPPLRGQPPAYLAEQLWRWKTARRRNDPQGVMLAIGRRLTRAEIEALADYASTLSAPSAPAG